MDICYIDTSVLVALLFDESGADSAREFLKSSKRRISHHLIESEIFSVFHRQGSEYDAAISALNAIEVVYPNVSLRDYSVEIARRYSYLRGADLLHVSCALWLSSKRPESFGFLTLDKKQNSVARDIGFRCVE